ncbi:EmrB/QacA subfamily drug resistance transporter [Streptomyces sp. SAI-170]|uniref:MFS transporter n=1 Tax=Streptomyces sp. SAI-170 TaxID=3377729 RepID=UPI003C7A3721
MAPTATVGRSHRGWTLALVCTAVFVLLMNVTIVAVALTSIQDAMDASLSDLTWVVNAYTLPLAGLVLTAATLGDRIGRKKVFQVGMAVFTLGSIGCALAQNTLSLDVARAVQGIGGTLLFAMTLPLIGAAFPEPRARAGAIGAYGASIAAATAVGPLLGGVLVDGPGWRWIFLVTVPVTAVAFVLGFRYLTESRAENARAMDWPGTVLLVGGLVLLLFGLIQGNSDGWGSTRILTCFSVGAALLVGFVIRQATAASPMLELRLFRNRQFVGIILASFGVEAALVSSLNYLAVYVQNGLGYDAVDAGLRFLPLTLAAFVAAPLAAKVAHKLPDRWLIAIAMVLVAAGAWLMTGVDGSTTWTHLVPGFVIGGIGLGVISSSASAASLNAVKPSDAGMATGAVNTFRRLGTAVGVAVLGAVFEHQVVNDAKDRLAASPEMKEHAAEITEALRAGAGAKIAEAAPPQGRGALKELAEAATAAGVDQMLMAGTVLAAGLAALVLVLMAGRSKAPGRPGPTGPGAHAAPAHPAVGAAATMSSARGDEATVSHR